MAVGQEKGRVDQVQDIAEHLANAIVGSAGSEASSSSGPGVETDAMRIAPLVTNGAGG